MNKPALRILTLSCYLPQEANFSVAQVNAADKDKKQPPKVLKRSLAVLRIEFSEKKLATSAALRGEYENRASNNIRGSEILKKHQVLWTHVGGPMPDDCMNPDNSIIDKARECAQVLQRMTEGDQQAPDGLLDC